ncbi:MAG TPA: alpha/beta hydrolase-fold protein [Pyrinomonadaceae bacterium]|nr:alpha/beta hydrolase-fold protein [Pyrinomonadaceae bacterium]
MLTDQIKVHEVFKSNHIGPSRKVFVYLPPGYGLDPEQRYPVIYMHDGQNLFDPEEAFGGVPWAVDETAQKLIFSGMVSPLIIVGVHNGGEARIDEYTPVASERGRMRGRGGNADRYGRMIIEELKPFIDAEYRTRPEREYTGIGGSSLGGLVSLHLGLKRPDVFSRLAVMSPSVWWANNQIIRETAKLGERLPLRIWLDIGKREGPKIKHQVRALKEILLANGWRSGEDLEYFEFPNAEHDESAWAARFGEVLKFLYPAI